MFWKASWPGVSMKVISFADPSTPSFYALDNFISSTLMVNAPICCVISPNSVLHLLKSVLNASSNVVLPWST